MKTVKDKKKPHSLALLLFVLYLVLLFYLLFFSVEYGRTMEEQGYRYNLELFKEIKRFWHNKDTLGWRNVMVNLVGNVVAFAPFGFFLSLLTKRGRNIFHCTALTAFFSLTVEILQLVSKVGAFDVDDIFLNAIGGFLGCLGYYAVWKPLKEKYLTGTKPCAEAAELPDNSENLKDSENTENE